MIATILIHVAILIGIPYLAYRIGRKPGEKFFYDD
jgi:hypothetical protein